VTVKQQSENPHNVVMRITPAKKLVNKEWVQQNNELYVVAVLDKSMANLESAHVLRQSFSEKLHLEKYQRGDMVYRGKEIVEPYELSVFMEEWVANNAKAGLESGEYLFQSHSRASNMLAFDRSHGASFATDTELFAMRTWKPVNAIKIYAYDFRQRSIRQVYELPVTATDLPQIQALKFVRVSDKQAVYALLVDYCEEK
jgi:hypothetical protein